MERESRKLKEECFPIEVGRPRSRGRPIRRDRGKKLALKKTPGEAVSAEHSYKSHSSEDFHGKSQNEFSTDNDID